MSTITLTATDGEIITRPVPTSWAQVPLAPYAKLAQAWEAGLVPRIEALAALLDIPAQPLLDNVEVYGQMLRLMPWLGELPAGEGVQCFKHLGVVYECAGQLKKLSAGQLEAIYTMQQAFEGRALEAAPGVLAVLFVPKGKKLTPELHLASTNAFASLPVSVAWPLISRFIRSSSQCATSILTASALSAQLSQALATLETSLTATGSRTSFLNLRRWLARTWIKSVRKTL